MITASVMKVLSGLLEPVGSLIFLVLISETFCAFFIFRWEKITYED